MGENESISWEKSEAIHGTSKEIQRVKLKTLESQSHPKRGVARTEQMDMMRNARAILVMGKSRLVDRKGDRVA